MESRRRGSLRSLRGSATTANYLRLGRYDGPSCKSRTFDEVGVDMKILVLPGDGIGPEITRATLDVLRAADMALALDLDFEMRDIGLASLTTLGTTLPQEVMARIPEVDGVILGPVSHYGYPTRENGGINPSGELRVVYELFANIRPCRSREGLSILRKPMDIVIVRENTEGFYSDRNMYAGCGEFMPDPDMAFSIRKITAKGSSRVARAAFELARTRQRKVTAVHKANVIKLSDGLFLRGAQGRQRIPGGRT